MVLSFKANRPLAKICKIGFCILVGLNTFIYNSQPQSFQPNGTAPCHVRVLLDEKQSGDQTVWEIKSKEKLCACDPTNADTSLICKKVIISARNGLEIFDDAKRSLPKLSAIRIQAKDNLLNIDGTVFQGVLYAIEDKKRILLINSLDIEDYIATVLRTESYPGWPLEMNKVMAITCRSYVLYNIVAAEKVGRWYHVKATNAHQTYRGYHKPEPSVKQAVAESQGLFLTHRDQPILAMYDICCGGVLPTKRVGVDKQSHPYLARPGCGYCKACPYCQKNKIYEWELYSNLASIEQSIKKELPGIKKLIGIKSDSDKAGVVQKIRLKAESGNYTMPVKQFSTLLKRAQIGQLKSPYFSLHVADGRVRIEGKGFGHCLGLCQWGAREMVRRGFNYKDVFAFYYPGCSIARLERTPHAEL